ncbi:hypothetical protein RHO13_03830 [Orbus wheelerorum]|uniref:hypothetical protein n=1 Tax=Orbus wheelerorum TaxID=3074111 RepID=UPI00370D92BD
MGSKSDVNDGLTILGSTLQKIGQADSIPHFIGLVGDTLIETSKIIQEKEQQIKQDALAATKNIAVNAAKLDSATYNQLNAIGLDTYKDFINSGQYIKTIQDEINQLNAKIDYIKSGNINDFLDTHLNGGRDKVEYELSEELIYKLAELDDAKGNDKKLRDFYLEIRKHQNAQIGPPLPKDYKEPELQKSISQVSDLQQYQQQTQSLLEQASLYQNILNYQGISVDLAQERLNCLNKENQKIVENTNIQNEFQKQKALEDEKKQRLEEGQKLVDQYSIPPLSETEKVDKDEENKIKKLNEWYSLSQELDRNNNEILLEQTQLYHDAKTAIEEEASKKRQDISNAENIVLLNSSSQLFGSMGDLIGAFGGESSNAYKALFAISKGFSIASATLSMFTNIGKATEAGFPANLPLIAQAMAQGVSIVSSIKSINLSGMAHSGIDSIPSEGTWLLDKGERVVDARTNADLKNFLQSSNQSQSGFSVNVPVSFSGSDVSEEDGKQLGSMIKQSVMSIIQEQQRPGGVLNRY